MFSSSQNVFVSHRISCFLYLLVVFVVFELLALFYTNKKKHWKDRIGDWIFNIQTTCDQGQQWRHTRDLYCILVFYRLKPTWVTTNAFMADCKSSSREAYLLIVIVLQILLNFLQLFSIHADLANRPGKPKLLCRVLADEKLSQSLSLSLSWPPE